MLDRIVYQTTESSDMPTTQIMSVEFTANISFDGVIRQLEIEGIEKFNKPFDKLMNALSQKLK